MDRPKHLEPGMDLDIRQPCLVDTVDSLQSMPLYWALGKAGSLLHKDIAFSIRSTDGKEIALFNCNEIQTADPALLPLIAEIAAFGAAKETT